MNANNQSPTLMNRLISIMLKFKDNTYNMMKAGLISTLPAPGATGSRLYIDKQMQINTSKSQRIMRIERGAQPEAIGDRRFIRYAKQAMKRKNSFCNNLQEINRHAKTT